MSIETRVWETLYIGEEHKDKKGINYMKNTEELSIAIRDSNTNKVVYMNDKIMSCITFPLYYNNLPHPLPLPLRTLCGMRIMDLTKTSTTYIPEHVFFSHHKDIYDIKKFIIDTEIGQSLANELASTSNTTNIKTLKTFGRYFANVSDQDELTIGKYLITFMKSTPMNPVALYNKVSKQFEVKLWVAL